VNFLLFAAFFSLQNVAKENEALFRTMLTDTVVLSIQLWVVGSTLLATGLFVRGIFKKSTSTTVAGTRKQLVSDGQLLFSWWMTLLAICFYAFMLGRSGF
jgi:predicted DNA-binding ArsR family transcriptional regulator